MRNIFIGDVHGCYDEMRGLIEKLGVKNTDTLYFVGDMINKGPKSFEVLEYIQSLGKNCEAILGNHEVKFLENYDAILQSPRSGIFQELAKKLETSPYLLDYLRSLPQYVEKDDFTMVHAGILKGPSMSSQNKFLGSIGKILDPEWYKEYDGKNTLIYGHWSELGLRVREKTIGIDTGCVEGGALSAFILETREIVQECCYSEGYV